MGYGPVSAAVFAAVPLPPGFPPVGQAGEPPGYTPCFACLRGIRPGMGVRRGNAGSQRLCCRSAYPAFTSLGHVRCGRSSRHLQHGPRGFRGDGYGAAPVPERLWGQSGQSYGGADSFPCVLLSRALDCRTVPGGGGVDAQAGEAGGGRLRAVGEVHGRLAALLVLAGAKQAFGRYRHLGVGRPGAVVRQCAPAFGRYPGDHRADAQPASFYNAAHHEAVPPDHGGCRVYPDRAVLGHPSEAAPGVQDDSGPVGSRGILLHSEGAGL
ncbi:hypothetical protein D3C75_622290 [compost metagenome]